MAFEWILLQCEDHSLGRLEYSLMPQQSLMELLIEGFENKDFLFSDAGALFPELAAYTDILEEVDNYRQTSTYPGEIPDIEEWRGVTLESSTKDVCEIVWVCNIGGSLNIQWLPATVKSFSTVHSRLQGTLDLTSLPPVLRSLSLSKNSFSGDIDLCSLPETLTKLDLSENSLSGSLNLTSLPASMIGLFLHENRFVDSINLCSLPPRMQTLTLNDNQLCGETDFSKLPSSMRNFDVSENPQLGGNLVITRDICFGFNARRSKVYFLIKDSKK